MEEIIAYIGVGSNIGDRNKNIDTALELMSKEAGIQVERVSSRVRTEPIGPIQQPKFLNCVASIKTTLSPAELLTACQKVENALGREHVVRWGPRVMDLDILLYGKENVSEPQLKIPHPEIKNRRFVQDGLRELGAYE